MTRSKGIALMAAIVVIVIVAIAAFGIVVYVMNNMRLPAVKMARLQAIYAAQAGIYTAVYNYETSNYQPVTGQLEPNISYEVNGGSAAHATQANSLLVDASDTRHAFSGSAPYYVSSVQVQNALFANIGTKSLTVTGIQMDWYSPSDPDWTSKTYIKQIYFDYTQIFKGKLLSGNPLTLSTKIVIKPASSITVNDPAYSGYPQTSYTDYYPDGLVTNNIWWFSYPAVPADGITYIKFFFDDGTSFQNMVMKKTGIGYLSPAGANCEIDITAVGEVLSNPRARATIQATYDIITKSVTSWEITEG